MRREEAEMAPIMIAGNDDGGAFLAGRVDETRVELGETARRAGRIDPGAVEDVAGDGDDVDGTTTPAFALERRDERIENRRLVVPRAEMQIRQVRDERRHAATSKRRL